MDEYSLSMPLLNDEDRKRALFLALPDLYISEWFLEIENALRFPTKRLDVIDEYIELIHRPAFVFEDNKLQDSFKSFETQFSLLRDFLQDSFLTEGAITKFTEDTQAYGKKISTLKNLITDTAIEHELLVATFTKSNKQPNRSSLHYSLYENKFIWGGTKTYKVSGKQTKLLYKTLWNNRCSEKTLAKANRISREELVKYLDLGKKPSKLTQILKDSKGYLKTLNVPARIDGTVKKGYVLVILKE